MIIYLTTDTLQVFEVKGSQGKCSRITKELSIPGNGGGVAESKGGCGSVELLNL